MTILAKDRESPTDGALPAPPRSGVPVGRPASALPAAVLAARHGARAGDMLLQLVRGALAAPRFDTAAATLATELAGALDCERVVVGMVVQRFVQVRALSHGALVAGAPALVRAMGAAMDEAIDQHASILHPQHPDERPRITLAHAVLAGLAGAGAGRCLLTVPLYVDGQAIGALGFERPPAQRFDAAEVQQIEAMAGTLAQLLQLRFERERPGWQRLQARLAALGARRGRGVLAAALAAAALLAGLLALPLQHQITAPTRLEGRVQRAVVAPVDGFLKSAQVRAGDMVRAGQLLAELSDEDLRLERRRWETEVARHDSTYAEAQARQDRAQLVIADARGAEARAQLALVDQQLTRTRLVAPFDALVIKGDLSQQLGAPVKRGDLLLTLAPTREFRVVLQIDEREVGEVRPGIRGAVTLSALPDQRLALVVQRVMPVARPEGGRNLFEAEATLEGVSAATATALRPGLQGEARLDAGPRALAWQLTHPLIDWLRLQWWAWIG